jgi:multidrug transporter EmrE-like cation transporter
MIPYAALMLAGTFISAVAQVLLKKEAQVRHGSVIEEYLNIRVIIAYIIFFGATFLSIFAYRVVPLSMGPILEATGYIWVTIFGVTIFRERMNKTKIIALGLIIAGIVVYSVWG